MMKLTKENLVTLLIVSLLGSTPIAYITFQFMFPNISTPSLGKNMMVLLLICMAVGVPAGYLTRRMDLALLSVIGYTAVGYLLAVVMYSAPYLFYDLELLLPSFYYSLFFRFTVILLLLFLIGGFVGAAVGEFFHESMRKGETKLTWD